MPLCLETELWKVFKNKVSKHTGDDWYEFWKEHFRDNEQWWQIKESTLSIENINELLATEAEYRHQTDEPRTTVKQLLQRYGEFMTFHKGKFEDHFMTIRGLYSDDE
jgi:hypothetical protein